VKRSSPRIRPLPVIFSDEAQRDFDEDVEYLHGEAGFGVAARYIEAVDRTANLVAAFPGIGMRCPFDDPPLSRLRRKPLYGRFSARMLFYYVDTDHIEIARIPHGKQNWAALLR
jgi:plasmid stabilization system protein ParE